MIETQRSPFETTLSKKRILIVDDIRTDLQLIGKLVMGFDHEVILEESAALALDQLDPLIDLIIVDGVMPGMDGFEFVKSVRRNTAVAHIPVIMVTSLSGRKDRIRAVETGVNDFITKPVDKVELNVRIKSMLRMKEAQDRVRNYQKELENRVEQKTFTLNSVLQKLQAVLDGMSDCMVSVDKDQTITEINQAFVNVSGYRPEMLKGRSIFDLLVGDSQMEDFTLLLSRMNEKVELDLEFPQWGRRTFSIVSTPTEAQGHILMMRDITEKKAVEEQRARFLSILSHELRTPLNGIKGYTEILMFDHVCLSEEHKRYLGLINGCGLKLETIVDELLRFVESYDDIGGPDEQDIPLDALTRYALDNLSEKQARKKIHITLSVLGPSPVVHGKHEHFLEILKQIIDNAIKFSHEHGTIELTLTTEPEKVLFICRDFGKGIPEKYLSQIFESFFQVEAYNTRTQDGLGLGLTITQKIIALYNGSINVESEQGQGTTVTVSFPDPLLNL